jgi:hypothetical protein
MTSLLHPTNGAPPVHTASLRRTTRSAVAAALSMVVVVAIAVAGIGPAPIRSADAQAVVVDAPVMGGTRVSAAQMAAWVRARSAQPYRATVSVDQLAAMFVAEGNDERVSGDLAFVQAVVETGWFSFSGRVPAWANNFGGIGATDSTQLFSVFRSARVGVRAHIQHLRAYGDPTVTVANLAHPLEDPRFSFVVPFGKAPMWSNMGAGNWATDPLYASKILALYSDLVAFAGYPAPPPPFGNLDAATAAGVGQIRVRGWAIDPDTTAPIGVHVYVNGAYAGATTASRVRTDVAAVWPAWGPNHGFDVNIGASGGRNQVCAYAINVGPGTTNSPLGCAVVQLPGGNPFGSVDAVTTVGPGQVRVRGWVVDPDTTAPIEMHVYASGRYIGATTASRPRADVGAAFPAYGPNHGFDVTLNAPGGRTEVCAFGINVGSGTTNPRLGCVVVQSPTGNPFGNVDTVTPAGAAQVRVQGWAIDPDTTAPVRMHLYVDGRLVGDIEASTLRSDVGAVFAGYGNNHGFDGTVAVSPAGSTVCVFALNAGPGTANTLLGCTRT